MLSDLFLRQNAALDSPFLDKMQALRALDGSLMRLSFGTEKWAYRKDINSLIRDRLGLLYGTSQPYVSQILSGFGLNSTFKSKSLSDVLDARLFGKFPDPSEWEEHVNSVLRYQSSAVGKFARLGWFLPALSLMLSTWLVEVRSLKDGRYDEIDAFMCRLMEEWISLEYIETLLCQLFSHRAGPLKQAFEAHRGENYYVSIPVFLAQADGISHELFGKSVYSRYHRDEKPRKGKSGAGNPIYRDIIDGKQLGDYWMAYLESYRNPSPLNARSGERDTNPLNRHAILHGESTTYGTYINSLKAISFLLSVGTVLSEIKVEVSSVCAEALRRTFGK